MRVARAPAPVADPASRKADSGAAAGRSGAAVPDGLYPKFAPAIRMATEEALEIVIASIIWPFIGGEDVFTKQKGGAGIGLAITKRLIELHGGCFEIDSTVGGGASVRLWFPARRCSATSARGNCGRPT